MLSPAQMKQREGRLTASRIACLMTGDQKKIHQLWLELTGQAAPEDLSQVWAVRLGEATEPLHLDWLEFLKFTIVRRGEFVTHPRHDWLGATLDGWCSEINGPLEAKHVGGREPLEVVIERYQPQVQCQMEVTGANECMLSVIMGASAPIQETIGRDEAYAAEMMARAAQFMECVRTMRPPVDLPAAPAPIDATRVYDFSLNNTWTVNAAEWLGTKDAAKMCEDAKAILKSIVPADAKKVYGHGVYISRNRAGALSLREGTG
jgi:predicted phage-related endonuclease